MRRLRIPVEFTQGMKPHVRLIASPPLPLGMTSRAEYLDFGLGSAWSEELMQKFGMLLPPGFEASQVLPVAPGGPSLGAIDSFLYRAELPASAAGVDYAPAIQKIWESADLPILRSGPERARAFDARPALWKLEQESLGVILVGLKSQGSAMPRVGDILGLLMPDSGVINALTLNIERLGMWWEQEGERRSPDEITNLAIATDKQLTLGEKR